MGVSQISCVEMSLSQMRCAFFQPKPISSCIFSWVLLRLYHQKWQRREADKTKFSFCFASECASAIARYAADSASVAKSALNLNFCAARINCLISHKLLPSDQLRAGCNLCWMHEIIFLMLYPVHHMIKYFQGCLFKWYILQKQE